MADENGSAAGEQRRASVDMADVDADAICKSQLNFEALVSKSSSRASSVSHLQLPAAALVKVEGDKSEAGVGNPLPGPVVGEKHPLNAEPPANPAEDAPMKRRRFSPPLDEGAVSEDKVNHASEVSGPAPPSPSSSATVSAPASPKHEEEEEEEDSPTAAVAMPEVDLEAPHIEDAPDSAVPPTGETVKSGRASRARTPLPMAPDDAEPSMSILYSSGSMLPKLHRHLHQIVEVRVPAKYLTTRNKEIQTRQLWGTDKYTDDSDVVAVLMHTGKFFLRPTPPSKLAGISVFLRVLEQQSNYEASTRFQLRSRSWAPQYHRCTIELVRTQLLREMNQLDHRAPTTNSRSNKTVAASNGRRSLSKRRFVTDVTLMFNSTNDPCLKYCLGLVGDRGMNRDEWTSTRLQREVLYLESGGRRLELSRMPPNGSQFDRYRLAQCCTEKLRLNSSQWPLQASQELEAVEGLDWEEIEWGPSSFKVRGVEYPVDTMWFRPVAST